MSGIDELRDTLSRQAGSVTDDGLRSRAAAVRARGAAVRRRRRVGTAVTAAVVLAGGATGGTMTHLRHDREPGPVTHVKHPDSFHGQYVPEQMSVLGERYVLTGFVTGTGSASVPLGASSSDRVVTWATQFHSDLVSIQAPVPDRTYATTDRGGPSAFEDYVQVPAGSSGDVVVTDTTPAPGDVALAVYAEDTSESAFRFAPTLDGGWTFRRGFFAVPGSTFGDSVDTDEDSLYVAACAGDPSDRLTLSVDSQQVGATTCQAPHEITSTHDSHVLSTEVPQDFPTSSPEIDAGLHGSSSYIGYAAYVRAQEGTVAGQSVPTQVTRFGHVWQFAGHALGDVADGATSVGMPRDAGPMLLWPVVPPAHGCHTVSVDDGPANPCDDPATDGTLGVVAGDSAHTVTLGFSGADASALEQDGQQVGVAYYEQVR